MKIKSEETKEKYKYKAIKVQEEVMGNREMKKKKRGKQLWE